MQDGDDSITPPDRPPMAIRQQQQAGRPVTSVTATAAERSNAIEPLVRSLFVHVALGRNRAREGVQNGNS